MADVPDQLDSQPDPKAPVRVILAGGGSHEGLPAGWFLGAGPHAALRYPDGHLELLLGSEDEASEDASAGVPGPLVDGLPEALEEADSASAPKRARNKPTAPDQPPDPDQTAPEPEPAQSPEQE